MLTIKLALMALARPIVRLIVKSNSCLAFLAVNRGVDLLLSHFYRTFIALFLAIEMGVYLLVSLFLKAS